MISPKPNAPVYTLPRTFFNTHRSDIYPPANTPNSEDKAIEMVDTKIQRQKRGKKGEESCIGEV